MDTTAFPEGVRLIQVSLYECSHAITFPTFNSPQQMVNVNYFLFLHTFHVPFSFNPISFYLGWYLSTKQGLKWHLSRYPWPYWQTLQLWRLHARSIYFGWKMFFQKRNVYPPNVWFITVIAFNSVSFCRNNSFKIRSTAPSNLICNIWIVAWKSRYALFSFVPVQVPLWLVFNIPDFAFILYNS